jgi:hypothetical protein
VSRRLLWFGVLGAPAAWVVQHLTGFVLTEGACHDLVGRTAGVELDAPTLAVTFAAAAITVGAGLAAAVTLRATRGADHEGPPPAGLMRFLAVIGVAIAPLFLAMILMSGLGSVLVDGCRQA